MHSRVDLQSIITHTHPRARIRTCKRVQSGYSFVSKGLQTCERSLVGLLIIINSSCVETAPRKRSLLCESRQVFRIVWSHRFPDQMSYDQIRVECLVLGVRKLCVCVYPSFIHVCMCSTYKGIYPHTTHTHLAFLLAYSDTLFRGATSCRTGCLFRRAGPPTAKSVLAGNTRTPKQAQAQAQTRQAQAQAQAQLPHVRGNVET